MSGTSAYVVKATASFLIAIVLAYLLIIIADAQGETQLPSVYETDPSAYDEHLTALDREALDEAYRKYRMELFAGWLKDPSQQPKRAIFGAEKARAVYLRVITAIDQRPKRDGSLPRTPSTEGMPPGTPRAIGK